MASSSNTRKRQQFSESMPFTALNHGPRASNVTTIRREEGGIVEGVPPPFGSVAHPDRSEELLVITSIRAMDVAIGLRRIPAGFYIAVQHSGLEWRTANMPVSVNKDVVEWEEPIPLPTDLSSGVHLGIYASFEFKSVLGDGEQLQTLKTTAQRLLNLSLEGQPFTFSPEEGSVVSSCSSLLVTTGQRGPRILDPHRSTTAPIGELEEATNQGHCALSRYRKHGKRRDLDYSIDRFEHALSICLLDHPCYAAAQSNLATAKLIHWKVAGTNSSLNVSFSLYCSALAAHPIGHPDRPSTLIQLAILLLARFGQRHEKYKGGSAQAEALLSHAINLSSAGSYENLAAMTMLQACRYFNEANTDQEDDRSLEEQDSALGAANEDPLAFSVQLLRRFEQSSDLADLHRAISLLTGLATPVRDRQQPGALMRLGIALWHRFRRMGELNDLEEAISTHKEALRLTAGDHPEKSARINNLVVSLGTRFEHFGELSDLEEAISRQKESLQLTPDDHPERFIHLRNYANCFATRFQRLGLLRDLDEAISNQKEALRFAPDDHADKASSLNLLACLLCDRFHRIGELSDLEQAILSRRESIQLTPDDHPDKPFLLVNLAISISHRFERLGALSDLEETISWHRDALRLTPDSHPNKHDQLGYLASALLARFERLGEQSDLEEAIFKCREALQLTSDGHPSRYVRLNNLARTLATRFGRLGEHSDLEEMILKSREALLLIPDGHLNKSVCLSNLGASFRTRFSLLGERSDLEEAISISKEAVLLTPNGHPNKPICLGTLATCFKDRFDRLGEQSDLEEAISKFREALSLSPDGLPNRRLFLDGLASSLRDRFRQLDELGDLEEAISKYREALEVTPDDHPDKRIYLNNFAITLSHRFERLGEPSDLEEAISKYTEALRFIPDGHLDKPDTLEGLAASLNARFERFGELSSLEEAIGRHKEAVQLLSENHPGKARYLTNLATSFANRFRQYGERSDLEEAISNHREAVRLTPDNDPNKHVHLSNLALSCATRFDHSCELTDLEDAISRHREAIQAISDGHFHKPRALSNLAVALQARFQRLGTLSDFLEAISLHEEALRHTPDDHPEKPIRLTNFASSLLHCFQVLGEPRYLDDAISRHREAVQLIPSDHPNKPVFLDNLASSLYTRFQCLAELRDLEEANLQYSCAALASTGPPSLRFSASRQWIACARSLGHPSLLRAYSIAIGLLPQLAWIGLSFEDRYQRLVQGANVVREGAAAALDLGQYETAVEWLEQGRSVVWGELFQLRSSFENLWSAHPDHARQLHQLSAALERVSTASNRSWPPLSSLRKTSSPEHDFAHSTSLEQERDRHHALATKRDDLLKTIRKLPGFHRFFLHKEFLELRAAAHSGPVIILNAAERRCDALIIQSHVEGVLHVPLPNFTLQRCRALRGSLDGLLRQARGDKERKQMPYEHISWESILSALWEEIVKPILGALPAAFSVRVLVLPEPKADPFIYVYDQTPGNLSRIFWCPTGPFTFLPIHAAGFYGAESMRPGRRISDFVVSSYVPTLSILMPPSRSVVGTTSSGDFRLLVVPQPPSDGQSLLPGVDAELEYIKAAIENSPFTQSTLVESYVGTVEEVLTLMKDANWVHFACHGIQDPESPTESGLCLADQRRLRLADLTSLSCTRGGLAFLSACETATGDSTLSDEALHAAAGMLFAGYEGVIGTMWSISDNVAPLVARDVYGRLLQTGDGTPEHREAARALHDATGRLREEGASFVEWLPFVHVGL